MTAPLTGPIVVAGGCGAVGAMFAAAFRADGHRVQILDPAAGPHPPGDVPALPADVRAPTGEAAAAVREAALLVLAVPEPVACAALPALAELLAPTALLVETASVKTPLAAALRRTLPRQQALGLNPMFAPDLGLPGRPVVAVRHHDGPAVDAAVRALHGWGARVVEMTADGHDRSTAATQALTHAAVLAFGMALAQLDPPAGTDDSAPPPHVLLRTLLARVASGVPEVYHDIQAANPYAAEARRALRAALDDLDEAAAGTGERFAAAMARARDPLGADLAQYRRLCGQVFAQLPPAPGPKVHRNGVPR